ncbi:MAG: peptide ligase PGM1-related protein [Candidatus Nanopelagicales bacterium]
MTTDAGYDARAFQTLQSRLIQLWPNMTFRTTDGPPRTILVISSLSLDLPRSLAPLVTAYEERYLCLVLLLAKARKTRVVYVTSQPMLPRLVDYYLDLIPGVDRNELRERLTVVSLSDNSFRPLTQKILERPRVVQRLRSALQGNGRDLMLPFVTSELEARLALELQIPVYGPDPGLASLGTKTGSRAVFTAAGVALPVGVDGVRDERDLASAVEEIHTKTGARKFIVKTDEGVSGLGNAIVELSDGEDIKDFAAAVRRLACEDEELDSDSYLELLSKHGGVVEEFLAADEVTSPSVQLRASPLGEVEILSTHDQILGGPNGQTYIGCRFPADPAYATALVEPSLAIGRELSSRGVFGRFAIDYVAAKNVKDSDDQWRCSAVEINLRNGGTTHPALTLQALTDASYEPEQAQLVSRGSRKHYLATDHMHHPSFSSLTPDDLLDIVEENGLGWDDETQTGVAFHMASAIAVAGDVGVTAIADSPRQSQWLYDAAKHALIGATADPEQIPHSPEEERGN